MSSFFSYSQDDLGNTVQAKLCLAFREVKLHKQCVPKFHLGTIKICYYTLILLLLPIYLALFFLGTENMTTLKIENPEIENKLINFVKTQKKDLEEVAIEAIQQFINSLQAKETKYKKKDVTKYMHVIEKDYDIKQADDTALEHIEDSAKYIHDLRRQKIAL